MRYHEGPGPLGIGAPVDTGDFTSAAATYTLLLGIATLLFGLRVRRPWVIGMGIGLTLISGGYLIASLLGLT